MCEVIRHISVTNKATDTSSLHGTEFSTGTVLPTAYKSCV